MDPPPPQNNTYERKIHNLLSLMLHPQYKKPLLCVLICWGEKEIELLKILTIFFYLCYWKVINDFTLCNILPIVILRHELLKIVFLNILARSICEPTRESPNWNLLTFLEIPSGCGGIKCLLQQWKKTCTIGSQNETWHILSLISLLSS